jgi:SnoaL-like domain
MEGSWLDRYVDAWVLHAVAGGVKGADELSALLGRMTTDVRYEDVPTAAVFVGHPGVTQMCEAAHRWAQDLRFTVLTRQTDGEMFALETETTGTTAATPGATTTTARTFVLRGVSVGRTDRDGLVCEHRDYWDLGAFLAQVSSPAGGNS